MKMNRVGVAAAKMDARAAIRAHGLTESWQNRIGATRRSSENEVDQSQK
jgi:hypothetical protein